MNQLWQISGIILWVLIVGYILLRVIFRKWWMLKVGGNFFLGSGLMSASKKLVSEANDNSLKKETITEVAVHVFWRLTRIGLIGILIASIPFILLFQQNKLIKKQNTKIDIQNNLIEAERRSSLVFLMSNVLDKVDDEIKEQRTELEKQKIPRDSMRFRLSNSLIARTVALSRAFKPYKMLDGDTLSNKIVSPERGQLFISLMETQLDTSTQNSIVKKGDFSSAIIGRINLYKANLRDANLRSADFHDAKLFSANLFSADLSFANLNSSVLSNANLSYADLFGADFSSAKLNSVDLSSSNLRYANLFGADLRDANLSYAYLRSVDFFGADLSYANFKNTRNLSASQLLNSFSLYECKNLPPEIEVQLRKEKPCLFTENGCPKNK